MPNTNEYQTADRIAALASINLQWIVIFHQEGNDFVFSALGRAGSIAVLPTNKFSGTIPETRLQYAICQVLKSTYHRFRFAEGIAS
ncbi:hypothetical protein D1872_81680 [compost metagenome]